MATLSRVIDNKTPLK